ncbi:hypothetical protein HY500_01730 [Candidatus Woesearchaeota archaeon]|nr:hypothetical protein [Candidatus Woesearchaeota archaeon]
MQNDLKKEIFELRKQLNLLNGEKERLYKEQHKLSIILQEEIKKIKIIKNTADKSALKLKDTRKARDAENQDVKKLVLHIKELRERKTLILKKYNVKEPEKVHAQIEQLEKKVETEALSPDQEKKIMKQINNLKKIFGKDSELENVIQEIKKISTALDNSRKRADELHKKLQGARKEGGYHGFKEASNHITEIKEKQQEAYKKFFETRKKFLDIDKSIKTKLKLLNTEKKHEEMKKEVEKKKVEIMNIAKIHQMAQKVEEKIKKKQKITTEDLLAFQAQK